MEPLIKLLRLVSNQTCDMEIFLPKTQALVWLKFPPVESLKYQRSWKRPDLEVFCNKNFIFTFWDVGTVCYQHEWLAGPRQTQHISCRVILITNWDRSEIIVQFSQSSLQNNNKKQSQILVSWLRVKKARKNWHMFSISALWSKHVSMSQQKHQLV